MDSDDNDQVIRHFRDQIPEVANGIIAIKAVARECGFRSKVAVCSNDQAVDPVSACVGFRGDRVKSIVKALGEHIDIVRWSDSRKEFIQNALAPVLVREIAFNESDRIATVTINSSCSGSPHIEPRRLALCSEFVGWQLELDAD